MKAFITFSFAVLFSSSSFAFQLQQQGGRWQTNGLALLELPSPASDIRYTLAIFDQQIYRKYSYDGSRLEGRLPQEKIVLLREIDFQKTGCQRFQIDQSAMTYGRVLCVGKSGKAVVFGTLNDDARTFPKYEGFSSPILPKVFVALPRAGQVAPRFARSAQTNYIHLSKDFQLIVKQDRSGNPVVVGVSRVR